MKARVVCHGFYRKVKRIIAPSVRSSKAIYADVLSGYVRSDTRWLDVGCGHRTVPGVQDEVETRILQRAERVVGVDAFMPSLQRHAKLRFKAQADIRRLPLKDDSFDLLTANMVVEHLDAPDEQFREMWRVLKPGGVFLFRTPNVLGYMTILARMVPEFIKPRVIHFFQNRAEDDVFRTHYKANSMGSVNRIARASGFEVMECRSVVSNSGFVMIPPLAVLELLWIRLLLTRPFRKFRTNFIFALRKQEKPARAPERVRRVRAGAMTMKPPHAPRPTP